MDNETTPVDSAVASSSPATTLAHAEQQNAASVTRVSPLPGAEDVGKKEPPLERTSSISEEYMRYLNNPENEEKRFPVDRKKLERLITDGGKDHESAESYFKNIEEQTGTLILWPSKLKIGAKSKKDPQVKVIGKPSSVQKARELILADLDAKATRVTLKIDIPFSEHSHVIGKEGYNIKKVHDETKCHIHFPDSNRSAHGDKSNQVSITGQVSAVEMARKKIRELLPVAVTLSLPMPGRVDPNSYEIQQIMTIYNVNIHIKPQPRSFTMSVVIRGTVRTIDGVKLAVSKVIDYFTGDPHSLPVVSLSLEISHQHHGTLIGLQGVNIRKIMSATDTVVTFPDPHSRYLSNQVSVNGSVDAVINAREQLMGCLPVVLMFDVHESNENFLSSSVIGDLMKQLDVFISVKPKKGQLQSVIIKSIEQNLHCVYQARMKLLECSYQPTQSAPPTDTIAIATSKDEPPMFQEKKVIGPLVPFSPISEEGSEDVPSPAALQEGIASLKPVVTADTDVRSNSKSPDCKSEDQHDLQFESSMEIGSETSISPVEMRPRSQSAGQSQRTITPPRLTPRQFIDYDRKKEEAQRAMKSKVESSSPRFPTPKWAGYNFSESMPAGPRDQVKSPTSPSAVPQGLSSINRSGFQVLARRASEERFQLRAEQDQTYHGVSDMPTLLRRLGLEHYQQRFEEEEVDFDTFLTMSESDLKEMGINTVGARRKLQIAISELKKVRTHSKLHPSRLGGGLSSTLGRTPYYGRGASGGGGLNRGGSLKHSSFSMSHSGRF